MKVLSLLQPWATLVVIGAKKIETRSWNTKYRGKLLIHASASKNKNNMDMICQPHFIDFLPHGVIQSSHGRDSVYPQPEQLPFGAIIGMVELVHTFSTDRSLFAPALDYKDETWELTEQEIAFGDYTEGRYGWLLKDAVKFEIPIPAKGNLSLWEFDLPINHK